MNQDAVVPANIGKYKVLGLLGRGSMGVVYKGFDPEIEREVAIKMLHGVFDHANESDANRLGGLRDEARSAGNLRHPNIITVFEVNVMGASPYIVMDYLEGIALDRLLKQEGALHPARVLYYVAQAALGLDYAHSKGIVHCDVKPSNLILEEQSDSICILDFGIAKFGTSLEELDGPVVGTPAYMSPEQIMNESLDGRSDVFSLAIVAFELLVGVRPFPGSDLTTVMSNILQGLPMSISECAPQYAHLEPFFQRALAPRDRRFNTCSEMVSALATVLGFADPFDSASGMPKVVRPQAIDDNFGRKQLRVNFNPSDVRSRRHTKSARILNGVSSSLFTRVFALVFPLVSAMLVSFSFLTIRAVVARLPEEVPRPELTHLIMAISEEDSVAFVRSLRSQGAPTLLSILAREDSSPAEVVFALQFLRERGVDLVVDAAIPLINSGSRGVRLEALLTLAAFPDKRVPVVLKWGLSDSSPYIRQMIVRKIGEGSPLERGRYLGLIPYLATMYYRDPSAPVREEIVKTLSLLRASIAQLQVLQRGPEASRSN